MHPYVISCLPLTEKDLLSFQTSGISAILRGHEWCCQTSCLHSSGQSQKAFVMESKKALSYHLPFLPPPPPFLFLKKSLWELGRARKHCWKCRLCLSCCFECASFPYLTFNSDDLKFGREGILVSAKDLVGRQTVLPRQHVDVQRW